MPRQPKLRKKNGYWYSAAGDQDRYFGKVGEVSYSEAQKAFRRHLQNVEADTRSRSHRRRVSVLELCDRHLDWVKENRSLSNYRTRKSVLGGWCRHRVAGRDLPGHGKLIGELPAESVTRKHLEEYLRLIRSTPSRRTGKPLGPVTLRTTVVAIKATWNWAADSEEDGGGGLLPEDFRPFAKVPRGFVPPKDLTEADLPTDEEIERLFALASADTDKIRGDNGRYRDRQRHEWRKGSANPYRDFEDILRVYYATGARTGELCTLNVRDFHPRTRQLTLGKHKRVRTQRNATLRTIQLGDDAYEILERHCNGKGPDAPIFTQHDGTRWTMDWLVRRFADVRQIAGVRGHITIYSFRDLYISELLMEGVTPFEVSKMAGTSLKEIERTYGHFFNHKLAEAQAKLDRARTERRAKKRLKVVAG